MTEELLPVPPAPVLAGDGLHSAAELADQYCGQEDHEQAAKHRLWAVASCTVPVKGVLEIIEKNLDIIPPAVRLKRRGRILLAVGQDHPVTGIR